LNLDYKIEDGTTYLHYEDETYQENTSLSAVNTSLSAQQEREK